MSEDGPYYAHSCGGEREPSERWQLLRVHLRNVADLARKFAEDARPGDAAFHEAAYWAGLLHDLGKYQREFRSYLLATAAGRPHVKVPHAPVGAAKGLGFGLAHGFGPAGHHQGLTTFTALGAYGRQWAAHLPELWQRAVGDCEGLPQNPPPQFPDAVSKDPLRSDVLVRMLFSCLVDADWSDTNAWKKGVYPYRYDPLPLASHEQLRLLREHVNAKPQDGRINEVRRDVFERCVARATQPPGLFTLTVPTGGGKTLASLAFALAHCANHEKANGPRRIIYVIPYLNILEQTAKAFYEALRCRRGDGLVFEHHSLAYVGRPRREQCEKERGLEEADGAEPEASRDRRMEENWEAPIIITTSVQFFESLFSNRPGAARKLHHVARSVVIFDECQTFPEGLYRPTLSMLRELVAYWGVSFVFCTATQPSVRRSEQFRHGIPAEDVCPIVSEPDATNLFRRMHGADRDTSRVTVRWPKSRDDRTDWARIAEQLRERRRALAVVNMKGHARRLFEALGGKTGEDSPDGVFHLSTLMCAEHRKLILDQIKARLAPAVPPSKRQTCLVASTQLVEAGVDFDFPAVLRAFGPLDAIGQAAGRCNREGRLVNENGTRVPGEVLIFRPELGADERREYPTPEYEIGASVTEQLLAEAVLQGRDGPDILAPRTYEQYFATLISRLDTDAKDIESNQDSPRRRLDFPEVCRLYRLIEQDVERVVVPFDASGKRDRSPVHTMLGEARSASYVPLDMARQLQPYLVNLWPHEFARAEKAQLVVQISEGWWEWVGAYDMRLGLLFQTRDAVDLVVAD